MRISLFGYGKTTQAIAKNLANQFGPFDIYDDHFQEKSKDEWGNHLLNPKEFDEKVSELEIPSPGFPPNHNLIKKAKIYKANMIFFMMLCQNLFGSVVQMVKPQPHKWLHIYFHMLEQ